MHKVYVQSTLKKRIESDELPGERYMASKYTVATKIIRQESINVFHSLHLRHNKS